VVAIICNSKVIEIYGDKIRVSQIFRVCQLMEYIAVSTAGDQKTWNDDITGFLAPLKVTISWRQQVLLSLIRDSF